MKINSLFLLLVLVSLTPASVMASARHVTVTGQCHRNVTPDRGAVVVTAEAKAPDLAAASRRATDVYERVRTAVKKLALPGEELQTTEYNMGEIREWENNRTVSKGFRARLGLRVETSELKRLGEVVAVATKEGITEIGALQTFLSNEKQLREHSACLKEAAQNARVKAEETVKGLDAKIGKVLAIQEGGGDMPSPVPPVQMSMMKSEMAGDARQATIDAANQSMVVSVRASFEIKD